MAAALGLVAGVQLARTGQAPRALRLARGLGYGALASGALLLLLTLSVLRAASPESDDLDGALTPPALLAPLVLGLAWFVVRRRALKPAKA